MVQFFDYGFVDRKNKPSATFTYDYLSKFESYNLHQTGSQMWLLTRSFSFLFADLVPENDKFIRLISLLSQIMSIVFAHAICEYDLTNLGALIFEHHRLFREIFPGTEPEKTAQHMKLSMKKRKKKMQLLRQKLTSQRKLKMKLQEMLKVKMQITLKSFKTIMGKLKKM